MLDTALVIGLEMADTEKRRLKALPYPEYLKSSWWAWISGRAMKRARFHCELCGGYCTEVHHTTYERLAEERLDDLVALCRHCHQHITTNGLDRVPRGRLLSQRRAILHSPEFQRTIDKLDF